MNALTRSMLSFASDYGASEHLLSDAAAQPSAYAHLGPTRATSIVACIPAFVDSEGMSISGGGGAPRGAQMGAAGHLDADSIDLAALEAESKALDEFEAPEGAIKFDLSPTEIAAALANQDLDVTATQV